MTERSYQEGYDDGLRYAIKMVGEVAGVLCTPGMPMSERTARFHTLSHVRALLRARLKEGKNDSTIP